ncbi:uncharacterized protein [Periplaneta americana]|uniref:uncharacterized protein isoform X3 n=1 Tax=Periplaneta americana TaxID=6978 RepID=UPI0037E87ABF
MSVIGVGIGTFVMDVIKTEPEVDPLAAPSDHTDMEEKEPLLEQVNVTDMHLVTIKTECVDDSCDLTSEIRLEEPSEAVSFPTTKCEAKPGPDRPRQERRHPRAAAPRAVWTSLARSLPRPRLPQLHPSAVGSLPCSKAPRSRNLDGRACTLRLKAHKRRAFLENNMEKEQCRKLIELYGSYKRLWDSKHPEYTSKRLREDAWKHISEEMSLPVLGLKKKMDSLLGAYRRERSREKHSRITCSGRDDVYISKWYAYGCFQFMADKHNPADTQDMLQDVQDQVMPGDSGGHQEEHEQAFGASSEGHRDNEEPFGTGSEGQRHNIHSFGADIEQPLKQGRKKRKRMTVNVNEQGDDNVHEAFKLLKDCIQSYSDPYYTYGQYIAHELRKYDPITLAHVKNAISNVIFEADTGKFQQHNTGYFTQYAPGRIYTSPSGHSSPTDAISPCASQTNINSPLPPPLALLLQPSTSSLPSFENNTGLQN